MKMRMRMRATCALWVTWLCASAAAQYSSDQCSWRGSGLTHESHARDVEQVYLRCSEGSLEWLYPTGAIIVNLRPNTIPQTGTDERIMACVKPRGGGSSGSNLYIERGGAMRLLLDEEAQLSRRVCCFNLDEGALFIEASSPTDISKRVTAFQYQLVRRSRATAGDPNNFTDACRPCSNDDIIMAVCTSDFDCLAALSKTSISRSMGISTNTPLVVHNRSWICEEHQDIPDSDENIYPHVEVLPEHGHP